MMTKTILLMGTVLAGAVGVGCGGGQEPGDGPDAGPGDPGDRDPPTTREGVDDAYESMANDCNGYVTRQLIANDVEVGFDNVWVSPASDPAGLRAFASGDAKTWPELLVSARVGVEGISDAIRPDSDELVERCNEVRSLFSPWAEPGPGDARTVQYTNVLLYVGEHEHVDAFPEDTADWPLVQAVPARLRGYIGVTRAVRALTDDGVEYGDVQHQHLPIQVACDRDLRVETAVTTITDEQRERLDVPDELCRPIEGRDSHRCVVERAFHGRDNRCTFVAIDADYETFEDRSGRAHFAGTLAARETDRDRAEYTLTVDRFEF